ncbi:MAG: glycosyltransferase family 39 protein [Phycisphaerales bacterium]
MDASRTSPMRAWRLAPALVAALFALAVLPVAFLGRDATVLGERAASEAIDERDAHLPVIRQFAAELPQPDLVGYRSATAPGYHVAMAIPARLGVGVQGLRLISSLAGLALVLVVWRVAARTAGPWPAVALVAPLAASTYVLSGSAWLTTDMASMALGTAAIAISACWRPEPRTFLALGALFAAALLVRQTNVYLAVPVVAAGILGSPLGRSVSNAEQWHGDEPRRWSRLVMAAAALVPGVVALSLLVAAWGGLTPPAFRDLHDTGLSPVAPAYGLALVGLWGAFLLLPMASAVGQAFRTHGRAIAAIAVLVAVVAAVPESTTDRDAGRWGGALWRLAALVPPVGGRSPVIVLGAALGAVVLSVLWTRAARAGRGRMATVVAMSLLALFAVQSANSQVWERYFDPSILVALAWLAALGTPRAGARDTAQACAGMLLLALAQLAISAANYWTVAFLTAP